MVHGLVYVASYLSSLVARTGLLTKATASKAWEALKSFPTIEAKAKAMVMEAEGKRRLDEAKAKEIEMNAEANAGLLRAKEERERAETGLVLQKIEIGKLLIDTLILGNKEPAGTIIYNDPHLQVQVVKGKLTSVKKAEPGLLALPLAPESRTADHNGQGPRTPIA